MSRFCPRKSLDDILLCYFFEFIHLVHIPLFRHQPGKLFQRRLYFHNLFQEKSIYFLRTVFWFCCLLRLHPLQLLMEFPPVCRTRILPKRLPFFANKLLLLFKKRCARLSARTLQIFPIFLSCLLSIRPSCHLVSLLSLLFGFRSEPNVFRFPRFY